MPNYSKEMAQLQTHIRASKQIYEWINGAQALAVLGISIEMGIIDAIRQSATPEKIASATGIDLPGVQEILLVLDSCGFIRVNQGRYTLSPDLALLASPTAIQSLAGMLQAANVKIKTIQDWRGAENIYTTLPAEDVLSMAKGIGVSPLSLAPHFSIALVAESFPELKEQWLSGSRHLEVGCGIGNNLIGITITFPKISAVGLEIESTTAREAKRRIDLLGIGNRVEVHCMDACKFQVENGFDTSQWSQFFFPGESRKKVLGMLKRAMKPGGLVYMPLLTPAPARHRYWLRELWRKALAGLFSNPTLAMPFLNSLMGDTSKNQIKNKQYMAIQSLVYSRWGIPVSTADQLRKEMEQAGFEILREVPTPVSPFSESRGQLLARRPLY